MNDEPKTPQETSTAGSACSAGVGDAPNPYHFTHHEPGIPMVGCPGCLIDQLDSALDRTMAQRDQYHEVADKLAEAIAAHMREEIGEHSSANNPWANALQLIEGSYCR